MVGVLPPYERFDRHDLSGGELHLWLKEQSQLLVADGRA